MHLLSRRLARGRATLRVGVLALALTPTLACSTGRDSRNAAGAETTTAGTGDMATASKSAGPPDTGRRATAVTGPAELVALQRELRPIRALYVNRFAAQSSNKMRHMIGIADSTEINGLVIDVKDEFGLNFRSSDPMLQKNEGGMTKAGDLKSLVDTIRAHGILPIARIVVFKDSVAARMNPEYTIRKADGSPWRDRKGLTWVNPYANAIWEYNFRVAEEAARMGFGEIQFDYIRFPEPYKSLPEQVFPGSNNRSKTAVLTEFLREANVRLDRLGVRTTADVFGLVTSVGGALEIGQAWEPLAAATDVMLPMTYPSHYPRGSFGIPSPNAAPRDVIFTAVSRARQRDSAAGITGERVRPWLQAFTLGAPAYGPAELRAQKQGVYDAGYDGWTLWNPGSKYDVFRPALEPTFVSRKKTPPLPMPLRK